MTARTTPSRVVPGATSGGPTGSPGAAGLFLAAGVLALFAAPGWAAGGTGASFLRIPPTAASSVMNLPTLREDGSSILINPGALSRLSRKTLSASYSPYLVDSNLSFLSYTHPASFGNISASYLRLGMTDIEGRAADRSPTGSFSASDQAVGIAFSRGGVGTHVKFIRQEIAGYSAQGFALDAGYHASPFHSLPLTLGFAVRNFGPGMKFVNSTFQLPTTVDLSASYPVLGQLHVAMGVSQNVHEGDTAFTIGTQYAVMDLLHLRTGYDVSTDQGVSQRPFPAIGFGIMLGRHGLDYAFVPFRDLGSVHRLTLSLRL